MARAPYLHGDDRTDGDLELTESEERLPWLDVEEEEDRSTGIAPTRLLLLGVLSLAVMGAVVGVAWLALGAASDEPEADGSVIAAPEEPYKTRPDEEGGKVFAGTGDTSFAVGEGRTRESQLADRPPEPKPTATATATPAEEPAAEPAGPSLATTLNEGPRESEPARGTLVQVGAYPRRDDAEAAWTALTRQTEVLNGVRHRVVEARVDIGRVYRLQAVTGGGAEARSLCNRLKDDGLACFVK